jgi:hypothetical protein
MAVRKGKKQAAKPRAKRPHSILEGSTWAIPLPKGGYGVVVVARAGTDVQSLGQLFCFVLARRFDAIPKQTAVTGLKLTDAGAVMWLPISPFKQGRWKPIGNVSKFSRRLWPVPPLLNRSDHANSTLSLFSDEAAAAVLANEPVTDRKSSVLPEMVWAHQAAPFEKGLQKALTGGAPTIWDVEVRLQKWTEADVRLWRTTRNELKAIAAMSALGPPSDRDRWCEPGDLFSIPLAGGGFGVVLIARMWPLNRAHNSLFLYGFNRRFPVPPSLPQVRVLRPTDAVYLCIEADSALRTGRWRHVGTLSGFTPDEWFVPPSVNRLAGLKGSLEFVHFHEERTGDSTVVDFRGVIKGLSVDGVPSVLGLGQGRFSEGALALAIDDPSAKSRSVITANRLDLWRRMNGLWRAGKGAASKKRR